MATALSKDNLTRLVEIFKLGNSRLARRANRTPTQVLKFLNHETAAAMKRYRDDLADKEWWQSHETPFSDQRADAQSIMMDCRALAERLAKPLPLSVRAVAIEQETHRQPKDRLNIDALCSSLVNDLVQLTARLHLACERLPKVRETKPGKQARDRLVRRLAKIATEKAIVPYQLPTAKRQAEFVQLVLTAIGEPTRNARELIRTATKTRPRTPRTSTR